MPRSYRYLIDGVRYSATAVACPEVHPLALNANSDWRMLILNYQIVKSAYEIRSPSGRVIGLCMTPYFEYGPKEDIHLRLPVTVSRPRSMRQGEYFVISPDNSVSQVRMLFGLLAAVAHAAAIDCRSLAEVRLRHPQAALLDLDGSDLDTLLALEHEDTP